MTVTHSDKFNQGERVAFTFRGKRVQGKLAYYFPLLKSWNIILDDTNMQFTGKAERYLKKI